MSLITTSFCHVTIGMGVTKSFCFTVIFKVFQWILCVKCWNYLLSCHAGHCCQIAIYHPILFTLSTVNFSLIKSLTVQYEPYVSL